jgi:hypothetical protein
MRKVIFDTSMSLAGFNILRVGCALALRRALAEQRTKDHA